MNNSEPKTKDQFKAEITLAIQNSTMQLLIDNLAAANVEISRLQSKVAELESKSKGPVGAG